MNLILTCDDILSNENVPLNTFINIEAFLVIARDCFLAPAQNFSEYNRFIQVCYPRLEYILDELVGGWVGGPATYNDKVLISGVLTIGPTRSYPLSLTDISSLHLFRENENFIILEQTH